MPATLVAAAAWWMGAMHESCELMTPFLVLTRLTLGCGRLCAMAIVGAPPPQYRPTTALPPSHAGGKAAAMRAWVRAEMADSSRCGPCPVSPGDPLLERSSPASTLCSPAAGVVARRPLRRPRLHESGSAATDGLAELHSCMTARRKLMNRAAVPIAHLRKLFAVVHCRQERWIVAWNDTLPESVSLRQLPDLPPRATGSSPCDVLDWVEQALVAFDELCDVGGAGGAAVWCVPCMHHVRLICH